MSCVTEKMIAQFVCGVLPPESAAAVREHLSRCQPCEEIRARMATMTSRLAPDPGEFGARDLAGDVITLIRLGRGEPGRVAPARLRARWLWMAAPTLAAAAVAASLVLVLWPRRPTEEGGEFRARAGLAPAADRWVSIEVFRASATGYQPVRDEISADSALAFAYTNLDAAGYGFLMILGLDDRGRVFWYYPSPGPGRDNPQSLAIQRTKRAELPEEIRHQLSAGRLRIFAVFSKQPLAVAAVEKTAAKDLRAAASLERLGRLSIPATGQQTLLLVVRARQGRSGQ